MQYCSIFLEIPLDKVIISIIIIICKYEQANIWSIMFNLKNNTFLFLILSIPSVTISSDAKYPNHDVSNDVLVSLRLVDNNWSVIRDDAYFMPQNTVGYIVDMIEKSGKENPGAVRDVIVSTKTGSMFNQILDDKKFSSEQTFGSFKEKIKQSNQYSYHSFLIRFNSTIASESAQALMSHVRKLGIPRNLQ